MIGIVPLPVINVLTSVPLNKYRRQIQNSLYKVQLAIIRMIGIAMRSLKVDGDLGLIILAMNIDWPLFRGG